MKDKEEIYLAKDWEEYEKRRVALEKAEGVYERLRLELGVREDNEHVGSGLGGNPSELFFLLSHPVKLGLSKDDKSHFSRVGAIEILLEVPENVKMKELRQALSKFFSTHPDRLELTRDQFLDPTFLKEHSSKSLDLKLLTKIVAEGRSLASWLDIKLVLQKALNKVSDQEQDEISKLFLKEMELPENYFDSEDDDNDDKYSYQASPIRKMLNNHPTWGPKLDAIRKRYGDICFALLSREELDKLKFIGTFPSYIALFSMRSLIGIERIVSLNLDERDECQWLVHINKTIDS
jgi:hypothetical protein